MNKIKNFLDFQKCPMCGGKPHIDIMKSENQVDDHSFRPEELEGELRINISSKYFIDNRTDRYNFYISINNNYIYCSDRDRFTSLYDLELFVEKKCECQGGDFFIYKSIFLHYDRKLSSFQAENFSDGVSITKGSMNYHFTNDYYQNKSRLYVQQAGFDIIETPTPYLSLESFNFSSKESVLSRLNSIRLLA